VGVLVVAAGASIALSRDPRKPDPRGAAAVVAAVALLAFAVSLPDRVSDLHGERAAHARLTEFEADTWLGRDNGQRVGFLRWAADRIPRHDSFAIVPPDPELSWVSKVWITYQLTPRPNVAPEQADWLVFYGVPPETAAFDRARFPRVARYRPLYAVASRGPRAR
jgi:hypothetical protein